MHAIFAATARNKPRRASALLAALAAGVMTAGIAMPVSAIAQKAEAQAQPTNSQAFAKVYGPIANMVTGEIKDWPGAAARVPELRAAIANRKDRHTVGNFMLTVGGEIGDDMLRRNGLQLMLDSGLVAPEDVPRFHYYSGSLAYNTGDRDAARASWKQAYEAGYADGDGSLLNDPGYLVVQSLVQEDQYAPAFEFLMPYLDALAASGAGSREPLIRLGLQASIDSENAQYGNQLSRMLIEEAPSPATWRVGLQVIGMMNPMSGPVQLDYLRLMREAGALSQRSEYVRYIEEADPRVMSNELDNVLAEGVAAGHFETRGDTYYTEVKSIIDARMAEDKRELKRTLADGRSGDGKLAFIAGDILYSLDEYSQAADFYTMAAEKGHEPDASHMRAGASQVMAGDYPEALQTLKKVGGQFDTVAQMWSLWAKSRMTTNTAMQDASAALDDAAAAVEAAAQAVDAAQAS